VGSLADTGMLIVLRSYQHFFRRKPIKLGGITVAIGTIFRLLGLIESGSGSRDLGLTGKSEAAH